MSRPLLTIIAALSRNRVIGKDGQLPWHIPGDLKRFRAATTGHTIIMGRKTFESLPNGALPNRRNIVISRQRLHTMQGVEVASSLQVALAMCQQDREVFVIGGGEVYQQALPLACRLLLTIVCTEIGGEGLTYFPQVEVNGWHRVNHEEFLDPVGLAHDYVFEEYVRR